MSVSTRGPSLLDSSAYSCKYSPQIFPLQLFFWCIYLAVTETCSPLMVLFSPSGLRWGLFSCFLSFQGLLVFASSWLFQNILSFLREHIAFESKLMASHTSCRLLDCALSFLKDFILSSLSHSIYISFIILGDFNNYIPISWPPRSLNPLSFHLLTSPNSSPSFSFIVCNHDCSPYAPSVSQGLSYFALFPSPGLYPSLHQSVPEPCGSLWLVRCSGLCSLAPLNSW